MIDPSTLRSEFPILATKVYGKPLIYFDNAATTQKPACVLAASAQYYKTINSNIHRGTHYLSRLATEAHEQARETAAHFIHASRSEEMIFTSGCTMGINMAASILGLSGRIGKDSEIIISSSEHHSNIVPWQMLCERTGATLRVIPLTKDEIWDMEAYSSLLSPQTAIVAIGHVSNATGMINPVKEATRLAKENNPACIVLIDGAQAVSHMEIDVQTLGCDFYAFSGHKLFAPTGIGGLWGKYDLLSQLPPWMGGGEMIEEVRFAKTTYNTLPFKYEAGTPNIEGAIAMAAAMGFMQDIGMDQISSHEEHLISLALEGLKQIPGVRIIGPDSPRSAVISFLVNGVHHYDLGTLLDQMGIAVRTGHHCCQPLMECLGTTGTTRISFSLYNTEEEVTIFLGRLRQSIDMLS